MEINIRQDLGENCMTLKQGQSLYDAIYPQLQSGETVELDFMGVRIFASPFFNYAIGQLLRDLKADRLNELLIIKNLNAVGSNTLELVIENAQRYYSDAKFRHTKDEVIREMAASM
ncbi:STAS-like domain-containing protein [Chamaesiphon sp.]|uniref:STAS-like domain-containing protein n=1 Tax=Chamaesiphon sp. TaxID=2814140 RepID=UPI003593A7E9